MWIMTDVMHAHPSLPCSVSPLAAPGKGSENTLPVKATPGKQQGTGLSVSNPNKLKFGAGSVKPLGSRNENAAAATGKGKGISLVKNVGGSGSKPMQHQRKKLGDISNRDRAPAAGGSGGGAMGGKLHLQAKGAAGSKGSLPGKDKATSAFKSGLKAPAPRVTRPLVSFCTKVLFLFAVWCGLLSTRVTR